MPPSAPPEPRPLLTINALHDRRVRQAKVNRETYKLILHQIYNRIERRNASRGSLDANIPLFVVGRPFYDARHAQRYVQSKLAVGGFQTQEVAPGRLRVSWVPPPPPRRKTAVPAQPRPARLLDPPAPAHAPAPSPAPASAASAAAVMREIQKLKTKYRV